MPVFGISGKDVSYLCCMCCLVFLKIVITVTLISVGASCLVNENCSLTQYEAAGFVGSGIGVFFSSLISLFCFFIMGHIESEKRKSRILAYIALKIFLALVLLIPGLVIISQNIIGAWLIGMSVGSICSTLVSSTIIFFYNFD